MLRSCVSKLFRFDNNKFLLTSVYTSTLNYQPAVSYRKKSFTPVPKSTFFEDVDRTALQPQYEGIDLLENADDRIKKIYSINYGNIRDLVEKKFKDLLPQVLSGYSDCSVIETRIAELTANIKYGQMGHLKSNSVLKLQNERRSLLQELRTYHFESYTHVMKVLDLKLIFEPEYQISKSDLSLELDDMRIRAFAESRRLKAAAKLRVDELDKEKEKFRQLFDSGELDLKAED